MADQEPTSMTNLTDHFLTAAGRSQGYDLGDVVQQMSQDQRDIAELRIDWDEGAGEDWAQVFSNDRLAAFVWRRGPLAFVLSDLSKSVISSLENKGVNVVLVASMDEQNYLLDETAVPVVRGTSHWPGDAVPLAKMSIRDLWWATV